MKRTVSFILVMVSVIAAPINVGAQTPLPIQFLYLNSLAPGENSALSAECTGTAQSPEVTCQFTQTMVRYQLNPKDLTTETNKRLTQLRSEASKDIKALTKQFCGEVLTNRAQVEKRLDDLKAPNAQRQAREFLALCDKPSLSAVECVRGVDSAYDSG
jgi:hypothetical protein